MLQRISDGFFFFIFFFWWSGLRILGLSSENDDGIKGFASWSPSGATLTQISVVVWGCGGRAGTPLSRKEHAVPVVMPQSLL